VEANIRRKVVVMRFSSRKHSQRFISAAVAKGAAATRIRIGCQLSSFCNAEMSNESQIAEILIAVGIDDLEVR